MSDALEARGLARRVGRITLLHPTELSLEPGQFCALFGPSGAGKTTLVRLLAGLDRPSAGEVRLGALRIDRPSTRVGLVMQDLGLWPHCSALRHVELALSGRGRRARALAQLDACGLASRATRYPHQLSGGEAQRLALARLLAGSPGAMLFDEPLAGLDRPTREALHGLLVRAVSDRGLPALYVTHDRDEALAADRLLALVDGRLVQHGPPDSLYHRPASAAVARLLGPAALLDGTRDGLHLSVPGLGALALDPAAPDGPGKALLRPEQLEPSPDGPYTGTVLGGRHLGRAWRWDLDVAGTPIHLEATGAPPIGSAVRFRQRSPAWLVPLAPSPQDPLSSAR